MLLMMHPQCIINYTEGALPPSISPLSISVCAGACIAQCRAACDAVLQLPTPTRDSIKHFMSL